MAIVDEFHIKEEKNTLLNPKISVIVPTYNQERYLEKCLESICSQTLKEIEIILINDGSTDGTRSICEMWAQKDSRIVLINQENKGVAETCNVGVSLAKGDYIGFVDPDDWIDERMYEEMFSLAKEYDLEIISCGINRMTQNEEFIKKISSLKNRKILDRNEALFHLLIDKKHHSYRWNRIFKNSILKNIPFPKGRVFEDLATLHLFFEKSTKILFSEKDFYYYRKHVSSILATMSPQKERDFLLSQLERYEFVKENIVGFSKLEEFVLKNRLKKIILKSYNKILNTCKEGIDPSEFCEISSNVDRIAGKNHLISYCKSEVIDFFCKLFIY